MNKDKNKIRYGVVGAGWIAQTSVIPAFRHAGENSELVAIFSGDSKKRDKLAREYRVETLPYEDYESYLQSGLLDAVYIASPNHMHLEHTLPAAQNGIHVLCEKPMAVTTEECDQMIEACKSGGSRLMIAYRLHFDPANLKVIEDVKSGKIGNPRIFDSVFSMQVAKDNVRLKAGGGSLLDLGIYCINASRYLFQSEPIEVVAFTEADPKDDRFQEVEEMVSALLIFPENRLASFSCSFGAADNSFFSLMGSKGTIRLEPAYDETKGIEYFLTQGEKTKHEVFKKRDQFAPELTYFSECILTRKDPEPSGLEGRNDMSIIEAIYQSALQRRAVKLSDLVSKDGPDRSLERKFPAVKQPKLVHVKAPSAA